MNHLHPPHDGHRTDGRLPTRPVAGYLGRNVVVTGGAGFIGSSLCRVLLAGGARVTVVDNFATGRVANLPAADDTGTEGRAIDGDGHRRGGLEIVCADVRDDAALAPILADTDIVFHLACLGVRHSLSHPTENLDVNAAGSLCVLESARHAGVTRVVHVSSSEVYGDAQCAPMTEDHPTLPHTVYGAGKLAGEACARAEHRTHGSDVVVLRPFNAYGPRSHAEGDSGEVIPRFLVQALHGDPLRIFGSGEQTRDFTHVHDTAATIARAGLVAGIAGATVNIGSGHEITVSALARSIIDATGSSSPIVHTEPRPGDVARLIADSTRARKILGHRTTVDLADGLRDLIGRLRATGTETLATMAGTVAARNWTTGAEPERSNR